MSRTPKEIQNKRKKIIKTNKLIVECYDDPNENCLISSKNAFLFSCKYKNA